MEHQPIPTQPDEKSTIRGVEGGTLTNDLDPMPSYVPYIHSETIDTMIEKPFLYQTIDIVPTSQYLLVEQIGPVFAHTSRCHLSYGLLAALAHNYFDFDLELTFRIFKHERARGKMAIIWYPGIIAGEGSQQEVYDRCNKTITNFAKMGTRVQRWEFDFETDDVFTVQLKGSKITALRTLRKMYAPVKSASTITMPNYDSTTRQNHVSSYGVLSLSMIQPYDAGNVGPGTMTMHCVMRIVNPTFVEYAGFNALKDVCDPPMTNLYS